MVSVVVCCSINATDRRPVILVLPIAVRGRRCSGELVDSVEICGQCGWGVGHETDMDGMVLPGVFWNLQEVRNVG